MVAAATQQIFFVLNYTNPIKKTSDNHSIPFRMTLKSGRVLIPALVWVKSSKPLSLHLMVPPSFHKSSSASSSGILERKKTHLHEAKLSKKFKLLNLMNMQIWWQECGTNSCFNLIKETPTPATPHPTRNLMPLPAWCTGPGLLHSEVKPSTVPSSLQPTQEVP